MIDDICKLLVGEEAEEDLYRYARLVTLYGIAMVTNGSRCSVVIPNDNKSIPINIYGIGMAGSGVGKTKSLNFINDLIEKSLDKLREKVSNNLEVLDPFNIEEINDLTKDGVTISDSYKSMTDSSMLKLMRILDLSDYFSINFNIDEFAGKVEKEYEMLSTSIIEIFDKGTVPVNLRSTVKTTKARNPIPMNMLAFGSPHLLFESSSNIEKAFNDLLQAGLARRSIFCNVTTSVNKFTLDANSNRSLIESLESKFIEMQDKYDHKELLLSEQARNAFINYMNDNTDSSIELSDYDMLNKIYTKNKFWLALKVSGLIACSNFHNEVTIEDYEAAISIVEDSAKDFDSMINRPQKYELIVDYLLDKESQESEYTLTQALPFYKEVKSKKQFWDLAKGYAFENNITLMIEEKRNLVFYQAKAKKKTNLEEPLVFSYSTDITEGYYSNDEIVWKDFHRVITKSGVCYSAHCFENGYRKKDNTIQGFDLLMLDIDEGTPLEIAKVLLEEYTYLIATTKSHQKEKNGVVCDRYRIILPMANRLELDPEQYSKFMNNIMEDLPLELDRACKDSARFFYGAEGEYFYNDGELFDADRYIPNTQEEEQYKKKGVALAKKNISGISQYIIRNESNGRNHSLAKLALLLAEQGFSKEELMSEIKRVNKQFNNPLAESELERTIFRSSTVMNKIRETEEEYIEEEEDDEFASVDR